MDIILNSGYQHKMGQKLRKTVADTYLLLGISFPALTSSKEISAVFFGLKGILKNRFLILKNG